MFEPTPATIFAFCVSAAAAFAVIRAYGERSERARTKLRAMYCRDSPIWLRNTIALVPLWSASAVLFGSLVVMPRWLALILVVPSLGLSELAFLASYRVPAPLLPRWLRVEIEQGVTPVARPTRLDWLLFWIVVPVTIVGTISVAVLILLYQSGGTNTTA